MAQKNQNKIYRKRRSKTKDGVSFVRYYKHNRLHNDLDEPAVIETSEKYIKSSYYKDGVLHRENEKPAIIWIERVNGTVDYEEYRVNGKLHRRSGPAVELFYHPIYKSFYSKVKFYIHGERYSEEDFAIENRKYKLQKLYALL